ncbi:MAG: tetratricopeptide repeat protein [Calditrichaeota bacterium]|nr:MAG: tetratricopeptide repeat protein [Calditrichota bacterium]
MKNLNRIKYFFFLFLISIMSSFILSCATSQTGQYAEDESFPAGTAETDDQSASLEDDDVLRLLGISGEETQPAAATTEVVTTSNNDALSSEIRRLESEVSEKDQELSNLKNRLAAQNSLIQDRERDLSTGRVTPQEGGYAGTSFRSRYDAALRLYYNRKYRESIAAFDQLLVTGDQNSLLDNCQYWKGECFYGLGNFEQAIFEFQKVFTFSSSNKLSDAQLKLGLCYMKLGNHDRAKGEFEKLIAEYPASEYVGRARAYINQL